jgi:hypothetical protein
MSHVDVTVTVDAAPATTIAMTGSSPFTGAAEFPLPTGQHTIQFILEASDVDGATRIDHREFDAQCS